VLLGHGGGVGEDQVDEIGDEITAGHSFHLPSLEPKNRSGIHTVITSPARLASSIMCLSARRARG
jgi:hypothetical protein